MKQILSLIFALASLASYAQQKAISGFTKESADTQFKLEEKFDAQLKAENLDIWLKKLTARAHHVGSPYGKENAEYMRGLFQSRSVSVDLCVICQILAPASGRTTMRRWRFSRTTARKPW